VFDLDQVRTALIRAYGHKWMTLTYMFSDDKLWIGIILPDALMLEQVPIDVSLNRLIERAVQPKYRLYTYRDIPHLMGQADRPWAALYDLATQLLPESVRSRLNPEHRLVIVPSGPLHALPWSLLRLDDSWLVERAIVQLVPSLHTWQMLLDQPPPQSTSALLIGCSIFDGRAQTLEAVSKELDTVSTRWSGLSTQLLDTQATRSALLDRSVNGELSKNSLLHFATHAQSLPRFGRVAHIKLWDGDLLLPEIANLHLSGGLVVLSVCEGALADVLPGEEVLSLSWAFLAAGAGSVLASLWPSYDIAAHSLMALFYQALRQYEDAAVALAITQRALIKSYQATGDPLADPLTWGSFLITGK
jgi:CHAT domain-containing protein